MTASGKHNRLAEEFVFRVAGEAKNSGELLVVIETTILTAMLMLHRQYGATPQTATALVETAMQEATVRFAASETPRSRGAR